MSDSIPSQSICDCEENTRWCDGKEQITYTYNQDINSIADVINRFIGEAAHCESANVAIIRDADLIRFNMYLNKIRALQSMVTSLPPLDLSRTSPRKYCLTMVLDVPAMESDNIRMLIRTLESMRDELTQSSSSRVASSLETPDDARLTAIIERVQVLLDSPMIEDADFPNTTPLVPVVSDAVTGQPLGT